VSGYCSQKEKAHSFLLSVRHSQGAFGGGLAIQTHHGAGVVEMGPGSPVSLTLP
jgi:hypothetical protein